MRYGQAQGPPGNRWPLCLRDSFSDCRAVAALVKALRLCRLIGDPARAVVRLGQPEIGRADHAVGRPWQANHSAQPWQATDIAAPDTQRRQSQPSHRHHPQQRPNVGHQALAVLLPRAAAHALPISLAKRWSTVTSCSRVMKSCHM